MDQDSLLDQQVIAKKVVNGKWVLDDNVISILKMMYPDFRLVNSMFEIYPDDSFIYIGNDKYINSVKNKPNPHIIVANTGINLLDRNILLEYVYSHIGVKSVPKFFEEKKLLKLWDDETFYYNLKFILLIGSVPDKELDTSNLFFKLLSSLTSRIEPIELYLTSLDKVKYFERSLISFLSNSKDISEDDKIADIRTNIMNSIGGNISGAVNNLLDSGIDSDELRFLNFLFDLTMPKAKGR